MSSSWFKKHKQTMSIQPLQQLNHASFPRKQTSCVFQPTSHIFIQLHMLSDMCSTNHNEASQRWFSIWSSYFPQGNMIFCISINGICLLQVWSLHWWIPVASFLHSSPTSWELCRECMFWWQKPTYSHLYWTRKSIERDINFTTRAYWALRAYWICANWFPHVHAKFSHVHAKA